MTPLRHRAGAAALLVLTSLSASAASYTDVLGKTPKKGTPEHKEWEARRVELVRAVKKHIGGK